MLHVDWYVERRVILVQIEGSLDLEKASELNRQIVAFIDQGDAPVHVIVDLTQLGAIPTNLLKLREASHVVGHAGVGWIVVIGVHNPFINFIGSMLVQLGRLAHYRVMPTIDEAYAELSKVDDSLPQATPR